MKGHTFDRPFSVEGCRWEDAAGKVREFYDLPARGPILPEALASCMPVEIRDAVSLASLDADLRDSLSGPYSPYWDAVTLPVPINGRYLVLINGTKPPRRVRITTMEELLHVHYQHRPTLLDLSFDAASLCARTYNPKEEKEAYAVGAALLLPWREICFDVNRGVTASVLAERHGVSERLVQMRITTTGLHTLYKKRTATPR